MMREDVSPVCQKSPRSQHLPPVLVQDWFSGRNLRCLWMVTFYQPGVSGVFLDMVQYRFSVRHLSPLPGCAAGLVQKLS